ncbi:MAG: hypothetical protein U0903_04385 [Planctomycetales bacterium]
MTTALRRLSLIALLSVCGLGSGCSFFPEYLHPQEFWKLNRGPGYSQDPFFSVPDDIPRGVEKSADIDGPKPARNS